VAAAALFSVLRPVWTVVPQSLSTVSVISHVFNKPTKENPPNTTHPPSTTYTLENQPRLSLDHLQKNPNLIHSLPA
jgi:hypothetical protein